MHRVLHECWHAGALSGGRLSLLFLGKEGLGDPQAKSGVTRSPKKSEIGEGGRGRKEPLF